jgi:hypothetical protein
VLQVHDQLAGICQRLGFDIAKPKTSEVRSVLKSFLAAYPTQVAKRHPSINVYYPYVHSSSTGETSSSAMFTALKISPSSALAESDAEWVMYHDLRATTQVHLRCVSKILFDWIPKASRQSVDPLILAGEPVVKTEAEPASLPEEHAESAKEPAQDRTLIVSEARKRFLERKADRDGNKKRR